MNPLDINDKLKKLPKEYARLLMLFQRALFVFAGIVLVADCAWVVLTGGYNAGVIFAGMIALACLLYGAVYEKVNASENKIVLAVKQLAYLGFLLLFVFIGFLYFYGANDNVDYNEDAFIVLGFGLDGDKITEPLEKRLISALSYAQKNKDAVIVVSGGQGKNELVSEAEAMGKYLLENGLDEKRLIYEDKSSSTYENFKFSKEKLDTFFGKEKSDYKTAFTTNTFHIFRAHSIALNAGLESSHVHADLDIRNTIPNYLREIAAVIKFWILRY